MSIAQSCQRQIIKKKKENLILADARKVNLLTLEVSMFNSVILVGRLGHDPESSTTKSGEHLCKFSIATTGKWLDKDGVSQESTTWHQIICWKKLADLSEQYLTKGRLVLIEGEVTTNSWTDKNGVKQYSTEIKAKKVLFLDSNGKDKKAGG